MSTGTRSLHQNERMVTEAVFPLALTSPSGSLASAGQTYIVVPVKCYVSEVYAAVTTQNAGISTQAVKAPDGTVVSNVTVADASPVGTIITFSDTAAFANTELEAGEALEIEWNATPTAGAVLFTAVFSESA